jgi:predicted phage gp36 major capsid-like protein
MTELASSRDLAAAPAPEIKSASIGEVDRAFDDFRSGFEAWKAENDRRLAEIESRGAKIGRASCRERVS